MNIVGAIFILQASFVRATQMVGISCYSSSMSHQKPSSFLGSTVGERQLGITVIAASSGRGT
jgi:hypothetical protein